MDDILRDFCGSFKNSALRREDLFRLADNNSCLPKKHITLRWLTVGPATAALTDNMVIYREYFTKFLPSARKESLILNFIHLILLIYCVPRYSLVCFIVFRI